MLEQTGNQVIDLDLDCVFLELDAAESSSRVAQLDPDYHNVAGVSEATDSPTAVRSAIKLPPQTREEIELYGKSDNPRDRAAVDYLDY